MHAEDWPESLTLAQRPLLDGVSISRCLLAVLPFPPVIAEVAMNLRAIAAVLLLAVTGAARAQSEFDFAFSGTQTESRNCPTSPGGVCPGATPPGSNQFVLPWVGTISFITTSSANGVYSCLASGCDGDGQLMIVLNDVPFPHNWGIPFPISPPPGPPTPLRLTLLDGAIASLSGTFTPGAFSPVYRTNGSELSFIYVSRPPPIGPGTVSAFGTAPIPEPETWILLATGLSVLASARRKPRVGSRTACNA
jgi:hypothetical protein